MHNRSEGEGWKEGLVFEGEDGEWEGREEETRDRSCMASPNDGIH